VKPGRHFENVSNSIIVTSTVSFLISLAVMIKTTTTKTVLRLSRGKETLLRLNITDYLSLFSYVALLCRDYNYDSTSTQRPFDCLSKIIKVAVTNPLAAVIR